MPQSVQPGDGIIHSIEAAEVRRQPVSVIGDKWDHSSAFVDMESPAPDDRNGTAFERIGQAFLRIV